MVKFFYKPIIQDALKDVYSKSTWTNFKTVYRTFAQHNPTLAYIVVPVWPFLLTSFGILSYMQYHCDVKPKYYEHYFVMRPDDPRVKDIRHDDSLRIADVRMFNHLSVADF